MAVVPATRSAGLTPGIEQVIYHGSLGTRRQKGSNIDFPSSLAQSINTQHTNLAPALSPSTNTTSRKDKLHPSHLEPGREVAGAVERVPCGVGLRGGDRLRVWYRRRYTGSTEKVCLQYAGGTGNGTRLRCGALHHRSCACTLLICMRDRARPHMSGSTCSAAGSTHQPSSNQPSDCKPTNRPTDQPTNRLKQTVTDLLDAPKHRTAGLVRPRPARTCTAICTAATDGTAATAAVAAAKPARRAQGGRVHEKRVDTAPVDRYQLVTIMGCSTGTETYATCDLNQVM